MTNSTIQTTYLVTGVAGNLGNSVAARLLADGQRVRGLVLPGNPAVARVPAGVEIHTGDITKPASLESFFTTDDDSDLVVIHCAAMVTVSSAYNQVVHDINIGGTANIVAACQAHEVKKLVYVSSTGAIPETPKGTLITEPETFSPDDVVGYYGKSKAEATQLVLDAVRATGLDATIVFPTGICGPEDYAFGPVTGFIMDYCDGKMDTGVQGSFNAVDVRDLADAIVAATEHGRTGEGYILGNECVTMEDLLTQLSDLTGLPPVTKIVPAGVAKLLGRGADLYNRIAKKPLRMTGFAVYNLTRNNAFDSSKARRELGFTTRPFSETMYDTITWLENEGKILNQEKVLQAA